MHNFIRILLNPFVNLIMMFILFLLILNFDWAFTLAFIIVFVGFTIVINATTFKILYKKTAWKFYFSSIGLFLCLLLVFLIVQITMGSGQGDQGSSTEGILLMMVFLILVLSIIIGNLAGLILSKFLKED